MGADDPTERLGKAVEQLEGSHDSGEVSSEDYDRITTFLDAKDGRKSAVAAPESGSASVRTLEAYCRRLRQVAVECGITQLGDADAVNQLLDDLATGETDVGPSDGYANGTMQQFSGALSGFFEVHDDLGVDPQDMAGVGRTDSAVDSRTVLDRAEVQAMRDEIQNTRDRALFELMARTMQRVRAVQTLRIKDVDLEDMEMGTFTLNDSDGGLKGATGKRSLLGAKGAVRRWLNEHPYSDDPDAYLITSLPSSAKGEPGEKLTQSHISRILKRLGERADVDDWQNRVRPHAFRHYGVTVARRIYDMSWDEIAQQGGWQSSDTPKEIYEHLADEDHIRKIEVQFGARDPDANGGAEPTDTICPACDSVLAPEAVVCQFCTAPLRPEATDASRSVQQDVGASRAMAGGDGSDVTEADLEEIAANDDLIARLIQIRSEK